MSIDNIIFLLIVGVLFLYIILALVRSLRLVPARMEFIVEGVTIPLLMQAFIF